MACEEYNGPMWAPTLPCVVGACIEFNGRRGRYAIPRAGRYLQGEYRPVDASREGAHAPLEQYARDNGWTQRPDGAWVCDFCISWKPPEKSQAPPELAGRVLKPINPDYYGIASIANDG